MRACLISAAFLTAALLIFFKKGKGIWNDPLSPFRVFPAIWLGAVGISALHLSKFDPHWSPSTWISIFLGLFGYLSGALLVYWFLKLKKLQFKERTLKEPLRERWDKEKFKKVILLLFFVAALVLTFEYWCLGGVPLLSSSPDTLRWQVSINSFVHRVALSLINVVILISLFILSQKATSFKYNKLLYLILAISLFLILSLASRLFIATAVVIPFIAYHYLHRRFSKKQMLIAGVLGLAVFVGLLSYVRFLLGGRAEYLGYIETFGFPSQWAWLAPSYLGITMNFTAFQQLTQLVPSSFHNFYYGWYLIYPLRVLFGFKDRVEGILVGAGNPTHGFVASTYMGVFYVDFGHPGIFFGSLLMGIVTMLVYYKMLKKPTIFLIFLYARILWSLIFAIYANLFFLFDFYWDILLVWLVDRYVREPK